MNLVENKVMTCSYSFLNASFQFDFFSRDASCYSNGGDFKLTTSGLRKKRPFEWVTEQLALLLYGANGVGG